MEDAGPERDRGAKVPSGLHALPFAMIAKEMRRYRCQAEIAFDGKAADARSVLDLLGLAIVTASEVEIRATGDDAARCVDALARLLSTAP